MDQNARMRQARLKSLLNARRRLTRELAASVTTHRCECPPPFTSQELIVLAILVSNTESRTKAQIINWIICTFPYHAEQVKAGEREVATWGGLFTFNDAIAYVDVAGDFTAAFRGYEVPLIEHEQGYGVDTDSARILLQRWIAQERKGTFRFLDLPTEIRTRIYEMVLVFPDSTVKVDVGRRAYTKGRNTEHDRSDGECILLQPRRALDVALVSRQFCQEALKIFYSSNEFVFDAIDGRVRMENHVPLTINGRMCLLKQLRITVMVYHPKVSIYDNRAAIVIAALNNVITSLASLSITVIDNSWMGCSGTRNTSLDGNRYAAEDIPSLLALAALAAKSHTITLDFVHDYQPDSYRFTMNMRMYLSHEIRRLKNGPMTVRNGQFNNSMVINSA